MGLVALLLAVAGLSLALPYFIQALNSDAGAEPGDWPLPGWQHDVWNVAWLVGVTSVVLAIGALRQVGRRKALSGLALGVAVVGAFVWALPACVEASTGL
jgi:uncharacterized membrane protein YkgB